MQVVCRCSSPRRSVARVSPNCARCVAPNSLPIGHRGCTEFAAAGDGGHGGGVQPAVGRPTAGRALGPLSPRRTRPESPPVRLLPRRLRSRTVVCSGVGTRIRDPPARRFVRGRYAVTTGPRKRRPVWLVGAVMAPLLGVGAPAAEAGAGATCFGEPATIIVRGAGGDVVGTDGPDVMVVTGRFPTVRGGAGADLICTNGHIVGGHGDDLLLGFRRTNIVRELTLGGGPGDDRISPARPPGRGSPPGAGDARRAGQRPSRAATTWTRWSAAAVATGCSAAACGTSSGGGRGEDVILGEARGDELFGDQQSDRLVGGPGRTRPAAAPVSTAATRSSRATASRAPISRQRPVGGARQPFREASLGVLTDGGTPWTPARGRLGLWLREGSGSPAPGPGRVDRGARRRVPFLGGRERRRRPLLPVRRERRVRRQPLRSRSDLLATGAGSGATRRPARRGGHDHAPRHPEPRPVQPRPARHGREVPDGQRRERPGGRAAGSR